MDEDRPAWSEDTGRDDAALPDSLKKRASAGVFSTLSFGVLALFIGLAGNLVLARLLTPSDFGIVALGGTMLILATAFADGGLGSGLIRRSESPTPAELRTLTGIQLSVTIVLTVCIGSVVATFGEAGKVAAVMLVSLPISSLQSAPIVTLLRELRAKQVALIETVAVSGYFVWSISTVLAGWGIWGLATGTIFRSSCSVMGAALVTKGGLSRPSFEAIGRFRALFGFGVKFQAGWVVAVIRDQLRILLTGATGGFQMVGYWSLSTRVMSLPLLLFTSVDRVWFPAISQYIGSGRNPKGLLERVVAVAATAGCLVLSPFVAVAPALIVLVFGKPWEDMALLVPGGALSLMIAGPTTVACVVGYLFAANHPGVVLRATIVAAIVGLASLVPLVELAGLLGLGASIALEALVETYILARATYKACEARVLRPLGVPLLVGVLASGTGWTVTLSVQQPVVAVLTGGAVAFVLAVTLLLLLTRATLLDFIRMTAQSVHDATGLRVPLSSTQPTD
jgi:O-antigen/teichoic acid export membrane protein